MGVLAITRTACHSNFNKESNGGFCVGQVQQHLRSLGFDKYLRFYIHCLLVQSIVV